MMKKRLNNRYTGIYRTNDEIDNFKIRINLKKLYSIIQIPKFEKILSIPSVSVDQQSTDFAETIELDWQQKIFSKTEVKYYEQKENCKSELEKRYHALIRENPNVNEKQLIFTYINDDAYLPREYLELQSFRKSKKNTAEITDEIKSCEKSSSLFIDSKLNNGNIANYEKDFLKMHIMADLEPAVLLFTVQYRKSDGLLIVYPDFNDNENCYYLEIDQNSKQMYTYYIENISKVSNKATKKLKQKQKLDEIVKETGDIMKKMIDIKKNQESFNFPKHRILLLLEIVSAENFENDNIHVQYEIKLPYNIKLVEGVLNGSTHSSFMNQSIWHFGYCASIVIDIEDEVSLLSMESEKLALIFNVVSIDSLWHREKHEGIASLNIPLQFQLRNTEFDLECFRYLHNESLLTDLLERFFLGGIRSINHNPTKAHNRYGNSTVSTGKLKIKIQQIRQTQNLNFINTRLQSVDKIIESYHKAKARLEL
ncbi:unnamed protein product [Chironomus riparius]|uniref:Meckel syndrome type 1 protein n=1 Tax=Chironomus riparius TaxID=315576 RepID=A0A9N9WVV6_9DIPT|nr:unnamed protein product [Chironomus riparius]